MSGPLKFPGGLARDFRHTACFRGAAAYVDSRKTNPPCLPVSVFSTGLGLDEGLREADGRLGAEEETLGDRVRLAEHRDLVAAQQPPPLERVTQGAETRNLGNRESDGAGRNPHHEPAARVAPDVPLPVHLLDRTNGHSLSLLWKTRGLATPSGETHGNVRSTERAFYILF